MIFRTPPFWFERTSMNQKNLFSGAMASSPVVLSSSNERLKASKKPPKSESMITYPELLTTEELENFRRKRHQQIEEHKRDLEEIYKG